MDATASVLGAVFARVVGLLPGILVARALGPSGRGLVAAVLVVVTYAYTLSTFGVQSALVHYVGGRPERASSLVSTAVILALILGTFGAVAGAIVLMTGYDARLPSYAMPSAVALVVITPIPVLSLYLRAILVGLGRVVEISVLPILVAVGNLITAVGLMVFGWRADAVILGSVAITIATLAYLLFLYVRHRPHRRDSAGVSWRQLLRFGIKSHPGTLFHGINYRLDLFIAAHILPLSQVGLYAVATSVASMGWLVPTALGALISRGAAGRTATGATRLTSSLTRLTSACLIGAALLTAVVSVPLVQFVFGHEFREAVVPLLLLLPGMWALGIWMNVVNDMTGRGFPSPRSVSAGVGAAITIVLDLTLIPTMGIRGAAIASSAAYLGAMMTAVRAFRRVTGARLSALLIPKREDIRYVKSVASDLLKRVGRKQEEPRPPSLMEAP